MQSIRTLFAACTLCCTVALAADREFTDIVRAISDEFHTSPLRIPLFGLVNAFAFVARPAGARHIDLAVFEGLNVRERAGGDLPEALRKAIGRGWKPFVEVHSHRKGQEETVLVYMRPEGRDFKLLVTTVERDEATVIQLKLNPEALERWVAKPRESAVHSRGD